MTYLEIFFWWLLSWLPYYLFIGAALFVFAEWMAGNLVKFQFKSDYIGAMLISAVIWPVVIVEVIFETIRRKRK